MATYAFFYIRIALFLVITFCFGGLSKVCASDYDIISPMPAAVGVSPLLDAFVIDFDDVGVVAGAGNLEVYRADGTLIATVPVSAASIAGDGVVTFPFSTILACNTSYYVLIDNGALNDASGFTGISSTTEWAFTTGVFTGAGGLVFLIDEDFSGVTLFPAPSTIPPAGWVNNQIAGTNPNHLWYFVETYFLAADVWWSPLIEPPAAPFDPPYTVFNSAFNGNGNSHNTALESPPFDASGGDDIFLEFDHIFRNWNATESWNIEVWNGTAWIVVHSQNGDANAPWSTPITENYNITAAAAGATDARVRFRYQGTWCWYWLIDNIKVYKNAPALELTEVLPADNETAICLTPTLTLTYNAPINIGTANLNIIDANTNALIQAIPASDFVQTEVNTITYTLTTPLPQGTELNLVPESEFILDCNGGTVDVADIATDGVWSFTTVDIPFVPLEICIDSDVIDLSAAITTPSAWSFAGDGVVGTNFDPAIAGEGVHVITYTHTDSYGCETIVTENIAVNPLPILDFEPLPEVCVNSVAINLQGLATPIGGTFSGTGVVANEFVPATAGAGTHTITYNYTDANGCQNSINQDITVNPLPILTCDPVPEICVGADAFELTFGSPVGGTYSGTGVVGGTDFDAVIAGAGNHTILYTFTDANGCTNTCSTILTVADNTPPTLTAMPNFTRSVDAGKCYFTNGDIPDGTATDNCSVASYEYVLTGATTETVASLAGVVFNTGVTTVTWTATDGSGNTSASDMFTVTIADNENPIAVCENFPLVLDATGNGTLAPEDINNSSSDNCTAAGDLIFSVSQTDFDCSDLGVNTVTLTVEDAAGNTSTCTATVTVQDNTAPNAICQNITISLDGTGSASITPADIDNGSNDNCTPDGDLILTLSQTDFDCSHIGINTVTLTVNDANGNPPSTCNATVTVQDLLPPTAICNNFSISLDPITETASITPEDVNNNSFDNCTAPEDLILSLSQTVFTCDDIGSNDVTLFVSDGVHTSSCVAFITVVDDTPPVALCVLPAINIELNESGVASISVDDIDNGSTGSCDFTRTLNRTNFDCADIGLTIPITLTVTDASGNTDVCTTGVTVSNNYLPTISCPININTVITNNIGSCGKIVNYTLPTVQDNCNNATLTLIDGLPSGAVFPLGTTTVTYQATNSAGSVFCSFTVNVTKPTVFIDSNRDPNLCEGESITLLASPFGTGLGINYQWFRNDIPIPGATDRFLELTAGIDGDISGTYTALVDNGCPEISTNSITISVEPTPLAQIISPATSICAGSTLELNASHISHTAGTSYQWFRNDVPIPSATSA
ncbi:MAG: HYR domain-containing protein, partial [Bernardetiaceae bacterium]|nr:HYR domain-containing protein [Bernardetiaceae bacterium]